MVGFELGGPTGATDRAAEWDGYVNGDASYVQGNVHEGRGGGLCAVASASGGLGTAAEIIAQSPDDQSIPAGQLCIHRLWFSPIGMPNQAVRIARGGVGGHGRNGWSLYLRPDGRLVFADGWQDLGGDPANAGTAPDYGLVLTSNSWVLPITVVGDSWTRVEVAWSSTSRPDDPTKRSLTVMLDGQIALCKRLLPADEFDPDLGNDDIRLGLGERANGLNFSIRYDDVACNDSSGSVNNGWCGPGRVKAALPTSSVADGYGWAAGTIYSVAGASINGTINAGFPQHWTDVEQPGSVISICTITDGHDPLGRELVDGASAIRDYHNSVNHVPPSGKLNSDGLPQVGFGGQGVTYAEGDQITSGASDLYTPWTFSPEAHIWINCPDLPQVYLFGPGHQDFQYRPVRDRLTAAGESVVFSCPTPVSGSVAALFPVICTANGGGGALGQNFAALYCPEFSPEPGFGEPGYFDFADSHQTGDWPLGWTYERGRVTQSPGLGSAAHLTLKRESDLRIVPGAYDDVAGVTNGDPIAGMTEWCICQAAIVYEDEYQEEAPIPPICRALMSMV